MKSFDTEPDFEKGSSKKPKTKVKTMTLREAIDFGEYDPDYLATFPEWHTLSPHVQLQHIRSGLDNRKRQLTLQWAEINNVLDYSLKPELQTALRNIESQIKKLDSDREKIYLEYSEKF